MSSKFLKDLYLTWLPVYGKDIFLLYNNRILLNVPAIAAGL